MRIQILRRGDWCCCCCHNNVATATSVVVMAVVIMTQLIVDVSPYVVVKTRTIVDPTHRVGIKSVLHYDDHYCHRRWISSTSSTASNEESKNDNDNDNSNGNQWVGNDIYQRVFYRLSLGSDVTIPTAIIVEERCRFKVDEDRTDYIIPTGPRTILLRNGQDLNFDEDGEIGDDFYTVHLTGKTHNGAGNDVNIQSAIVCAMYLASNPELCQGNMMELSADTGFSSLLGCIGAGYVNRYIQSKRDGNKEKDDVALIDDDILTIGKDRNGLFPTNLDLLSITEVNEDLLLSMVENIKSSNTNNIIKSCGSKLVFDVLDWRIRTIRRPNDMMTTRPKSEFRTIITSNVDFTYPETKELARTVANRLEPILPYIYKPEQALPRYVHVCADNRNDDNVTYLRRILEKGYRMNVSTKFLKLEKYIFQLQKLPSGTNENELDDMELELKDVKEVQYQAIVGQHHPDYMGNGSGEMFFPIETGEYGATGGSTFLEKETGSSSSSW